MRFRLAPRSTTLDDHELLMFKFYRNFALLRIFRRPIYQGFRALIFALARLSCNSNPYLLGGTEHTFTSDGKWFAYGRNFHQIQPFEH